MKLCVADGSMMHQVYTQIHYSIVNDKDLGLNSNSDLLLDTIGSQWGFSGLTNGNNINLQGVEAPYSVAQLNLDIPYAPEFGAFILDPSRANSTMSYTLDSKASKLDFSREVTNYRTFLNLETMEGFY